MSQKSGSPLKKPAKSETVSADGCLETEHRKRLSPEEFSEVLGAAGSKEQDQDQDPHALQGSRDSMLEVAIGREVRAFRNKLGITASDLAKAAGLSLGMLSKIENGVTSASLTTLQRLSKALGVPGYFRAPAQNSDAGFVAALAALVRRACEGDRSLCSFRGARTCPKPHGDCPHATRGFVTAKASV